MAKALRTPQRKQEYLSRVVTLGEIDNEVACEVIGLIHEINNEDKNKAEDNREPIKFIHLPPSFPILYLPCLILLVLPF